MLLILIIILVLLGAAVIGSIYSNFLVFHSNFSESENYHKAYYASISALERGELVVKQRQPGYDGSGGVIGGVGTGSFIGSDKNLSGFSYLWDHKDEASVLRSINSLTDRIPAKGKGDVERMLSTGDSKDYNMMDYEHSETFLLYKDNLDGNPYTEGGIVYLSHTFTGYIRLPGLLRHEFGELDESTTSIAEKGRLPGNDSIIDRQIRGIYPIYPKRYSFTLFSTQSLKFDSDTKVEMNKDTVIRESDINRMTNNTNDYLYFGDYHSRSPFKYNRGKDAAPTIISEIENVLSENYNKIENIFLNGKDIQLKLSLLNLLSSGEKTYPFLEYYFLFSNSVPDKYFTINGQGNYKDYQVNTIIQKPTVKESVLGNFTSIF